MAVFFLSLLPISTFILQLICQGQSVIFHLAVGLRLLARRCCFFFMHLCIFAPRRAPHLLDLHRRCDAKVPPSINGIDKYKGEVLHCRLAGAGGG